MRRKRTLQCIVEGEHAFLTSPQKLAAFLTAAVARAQKQVKVEGMRVEFFDIAWQGSYQDADGNVHTVEEE